MMWKLRCIATMECRYWGLYTAAPNRWWYIMRFLSLLSFSFIFHVDDIFRIGSDSKITVINFGTTEGSTSLSQIQFGSMNLLRMMVIPFPTGRWTEGSQFSGWKPLTKKLKTKGPYRLLLHSRKPTRNLKKKHFEKGKHLKNIKFYWILFHVIRPGCIYPCEYMINYIIYLII